jgi:antitoxin component YwqK of YwqJK toxin-antitoxin module
MKSLKIKIIRLSITALCLLIFSPALLHAQGAVPAGDYPNKIENGQKEGAWKKVDSAGTVIYIGQFKAGKPYGVFTYFDTDARKMAEVNYMNGGPVTYGKMYSVSGKLQAEGKYVNQLKDSLWTFYTEDGLLLSQEWYKNGKKNGKSVTYHPSTKKIAEIKYFKNDLQDSTWTTFYSDGKKEGEGTYKNGKQEGKAVWYFSDGQVNIIGKYLHDVKDGIWIYYTLDATGKYVEKGRETWKAGKLISGGIVIKPDDFKNRVDDPQDPNHNAGQDPGGQ